MTLVIALPVFICLLGLVLFFIGNPKAVELGRILFAVGLWFCLAAVVTHPLVIH